MLKFDLTKAEGFDVIHTSIVGNSVWRTAIHAWKEGVNDLTSFQNWGVHEDSEEAFVVLEGSGFLFTSKEGKEDGDYQCCALEMGSQYLVEKGELHAILRTEGSRVLVIENGDMSHSHNVPMKESVILAAKKKQQEQ